MIFLLSLFLAVSCGDVEEIGNKLSDAEIEFLRQRASAKCLTETNGDYSDFIRSAQSALNDFDRDEDQWEFKDGTKTHDIYVWKQTASAVYFRIVIKQSEGNDKHIYVKWTKDMTSDLMKSVQEDECAKKLYTASSSSSTVTLRKDDKDFTRKDDDEQFKNFRTFTYSSNFPAFFGLLIYKIEKRFFDNDDDSIGTPETTTYTITPVTSPAEQPSTDYKDPVDYPTRFYCLVTSADATSTYRRYTSTFTDLITVGTSGANLTCNNLDTGTVTVGVTDPETFSPATELLAPF